MSAATMPTPRTVNIFLIEDNASDILFVTRALERLSTRSSLHVARDAPDVEAFLEAPAAAHVDLILLDLNLPGLNGLEVLEQLKAHERLRHLPVLVLTSSNAEADIGRARALGAAEYLLKPPLLRDLYGLLEGVEERWLKPLASSSGPSPDPS